LRNKRGRNSQATKKDCNAAPRVGRLHTDLRETNYC
jgi:hypothetical protein